MNKLPFEITRKILVKDPSVKISALKLYSDEDLFTYGVVPLDKPKGPTSADSVELVKEILEVAKAGHAGTLDPGVTGVLPIGLNKATRLLHYLLLGGKKYQGTMYFHAELSEETIRSAVKEFVGKITQLPPVRSSVKREKRERHVYYFEILKIKGQTVEFEVGCEAGTYIRKLCHDIGEFTKVGAHMISLIRIQHGPICLSNCVNTIKLKQLYQNKEFSKIILNPEKALSHLPRVWIDAETKDAIQHGSPIYVPGVIQLDSEIKKDDFVMILSENSRLIAVGQAQITSNEMLNLKKGLAINLSTVVEGK